MNVSIQALNWLGYTERKTPGGEYFHLAQVVDNLTGLAGMREWHKDCPCADCQAILAGNPTIAGWAQISASEHSYGTVLGAEKIAKLASKYGPIAPSEHSEHSASLVQGLPEGFWLSWKGHSASKVPGTNEHYHLVAPAKGVPPNEQVVGKPFEWHKSCPCADCQAIVKKALAGAFDHVGNPLIWLQYTGMQAGKPKTPAQMQAMGVIQHAPAAQTVPSVAAAYPMEVVDGKYELLSDEVLNGASFTKSMKPALVDISKATGKIMTHELYNGQNLAGRKLRLAQDYLDVPQLPYEVVDLNTVDWSNYDWEKNRWKPGKKAAEAKGFFAQVVTGEHPTIHIRGMESVSAYILWRQANPPTLAVPGAPPADAKEAKPARVLKTREIAFSDRYNSSGMVHRFDEVDYKDVPEAPDTPPSLKDGPLSGWKPNVYNGLNRLYSPPNGCIWYGERGKVRKALSSLYAEWAYGGNYEPKRPKPELLWTNPLPLHAWREDEEKVRAYAAEYGGDRPGGFGEMAARLVERSRTEARGAVRSSFCIDPPHVCEFDDNAEMVERVLRHLADFPALTIEYLQKRMVVYNSDGGHKYTPDAFPMGWEQSLPWFEGWSLSRSHAIIYCGEAWCLYFTVRGKNVLGSCHVYFATPEQFREAYKDHPKRDDLFKRWKGCPDGTDLIFIASDWCQRERPKGYDQGINLQTPWNRPRSLAMWIAGDFVERVTTHGTGNPFEGAVSLWRGDIHGRTDGERKRMLEKVRAFNAKAVHQSAWKQKMGLLTAHKEGKGEKEEEVVA